MATEASRILLVDGNTEGLASLAYALEALDPRLELLQAASAATAHQQLSAEALPFLLLVAEELPDSPGHQLLEELHGQHPQLVKVLYSPRGKDELRGEILRAHLSAGLFAFIPRKWLFESLGELLDCARDRYAGRSVRLRPEFKRHARFWVD